LLLPSFAFIEYEDPQAALSALRNMNDYELNGRRLRVNFSNSSHLEALAGKLGMDLTQRQTTATAPSQTAAASAGTNAVADALKDLSKAEMYDVVAKLKEIADRDPDDARRIISAHPQLPEAILYLMSKLDMVKTPLPMDSAAFLAPPLRAADPRARADPRQAATAPAPAPIPRVDPRQQRVDPRQAARTAVSVAEPRPPVYTPSSAAIAAPLPPPLPSGGMGHLDPALAQQVMSLTPLQIQQLPSDKRQSIMQLRQQITGSTK
jgi:cleavage stimulation factor subunit 2